MNITVYCSSRSGIKTEFDTCAQEIGKWIGCNGHTLVYGGMDLGDMRILGEACRDAGGKVIGVVPSTRRGHAFPGNFETLLPEDLNQRKDIMINLGDRFIALAGGYGTLDEILSTLSQMMFTITDPTKRLMIVNLDGLYDPLLAQLRLMGDKGLLNPAIFERLAVVSSTEEAIKSLPSFCI